MKMETRQKFIGKRIGYLTLKAFDTAKNVFVAKCDCGATVELTDRYVLKGSIQGCPECIKRMPHYSHNLAGKKFGVLNVLYPTFKNGRRTRGWECECDHCHERMVLGGSELRNGERYSCPLCGAGRTREDQMSPTFGLNGRHFGELRVGFHPISERYVTDDNDDWLCTCSCGERITLSREELFSGMYTDCGCKSRAKRIAYSMRQCSGRETA